jgi:hypothetical protein
MTTGTPGAIPVSDEGKLRAFAQEILKGWPEGGDVDGFTLQDLAVKYDLLRKCDPPPKQPCGEHCSCAEYHPAGDFERGAVVCFRRTPVLNGPAGPTAAEGGQS